MLVTDAQSRGGLATIRSLGRRGIRVTAADSDRISIGFFSRYCARRLHYPDPATSSGEYFNTIVGELKRHSYDMVIPLFEECLLPLAQRRESLEGLARFPYAPHEQIESARDKALAVEVARRCGLRTPATFPVHGRGDAELALSQSPLPLIVRPRRTSGSKGLHRVDSREALWPVCERVARGFGPVIIQEYIPWGGYTYDVDVLMNGDSVARAVVVCKRLRTFPPLAGPTSCGQAVRWPELSETAVSLLKEMRWRGPAEVEFRIDPRDGTPVFMEVNPRLWGSLYTGILAGVDFPYLLYRLAMDGDIPPVDTYRTDMKARYFFTLDLWCMAAHPRKRSIAKQWFADFFDPHTKMLIPSWRDPLPLAGKFLASLVYGFRPDRIRRRMSRSRIVRQ